MFNSRRKKRDSNVVISLTALVDAFTILVVFFLMQYSEDPELVKLEEKLNLPVAENAYATEEAENVSVIISSDYIKINDQMIVQLSSGKISKASMHNLDSEFIATLHDKIGNDLELSEKKESQWVLLADQKVPYETIKKTIYTLAVSGFTKIKLATTVDGMK